MSKKNDLKTAQSYSRFGPRALFGQFMLELAKTNKKLMVLSADLGRSSGLDRFKKEFPEKYLSVGISEQNLIGVSAGLAKEGYKVFVTSFAPFLSMRAVEHVRMNLGYMKLPVNLVALGSGISMGFLGNSHYGLEDISIMRSIPNINISSPADGLELKKILYDYSNNDRGPSYIRLTGIPGSPYVYEKNYKYKFNKFVNLTNGKDALIISTGSVVSQALIASKILLKNKIGCRLINLNTLKPIDKNITKIIKSYRHIITIEEHSIIGGLSSIVSDIISKNSFKAKLLNIALPDKFDKTGSYNFLIDYHGLSGNKISKKILKFLKK
ncbi:transketolase family protein [Candidatus Pelagibacter sp.]|uniref:transketolase family protein n=1 Tax=Candidatus Pelagibacter sp. TaxID=2024849 RepID=UPI003F8501E2